MTRVGVVLPLCIGGRWSELKIPIRLRSHGKPGQALGFAPSKNHSQERSAELQIPRLRSG